LEPIVVFGAVRSTVQVWLAGVWRRLFPGRVGWRETSNVWLPGGECRRGDRLRARGRDVQLPPSMLQSKRRAGPRFELKLKLGGGGCVGGIGRARGRSSCSAPVQVDRPRCCSWRVVAVGVVAGCCRFARHLEGVAALGQCGCDCFPGWCRWAQPPPSTRQFEAGAASSFELKLKLGCGVAGGVGRGWSRSSLFGAVQGSTVPGVAGRVWRSVFPGRVGGRERRNVWLACGVECRARIESGARAGTSRLPPSMLQSNVEPASFELKLKLGGGVFVGGIGRAPSSIVVVRARSGRPSRCSWRVWRRVFAGCVRFARTWKVWAAPGSVRGAIVSRAGGRWPKPPAVPRGAIRSWSRFSVRAEAEARLCGVAGGVGRVGADRSCVRRVGVCRPLAVCADCAGGRCPTLSAMVKACVAVANGRVETAVVRAWRSWPASGAEGWSSLPADQVSGLAAKTLRVGRVDRRRHLRGIARRQRARNVTESRVCM